MNFETVANQYLHELESGSNPCRPSTLKTYRSLIGSQLVRFNHLEMEEIAPRNNRILKELVVDLRRTYKPASIRTMVLLFKQIVDSLVDDNGVPRLRCVWNNDFISLPAVVASEQRAPMITTEELEGVIANHPDGLLFAVLGGTGMRISELLGLRNADWDRKAGIVQIRAGKTPAAVREIDLPMALNERICSAIPVGQDRLFLRTSRTAATPQSSICRLEYG